MKIINRWKTIEEIEAKNVLPTELLEEIKMYYKFLVDNLSEKEDYKSYFLGNIGGIVVLEEDDIITHLPHIGMDVGNGGIFGTFPEFVDTLELGHRTFHRITIIQGDNFGWVVYVEKGTHGKRLEDWIDNQKGEWNE
ncbi:hypothetical protein [Fusibacter sp. JL216-2]|uniref:hypothetical protein n=1 Tax=Fusibacter sp. JL216-2 TaxID=3071453 RepID=UPI003D356E9A